MPTVPPHLRLRRAAPGPRAGPSALAALAAVVLVLVGATPAVALPRETTPPPPVPTVACPAGQTSTLSTQAPTPGRTAKPGPAVTVLPDGSSVTATCALAPPTPLPAPAVAPEHTVGGAKLAGTGVVVDKPAGVPDLPPVSDVSYVLADMDTGVIVAAKDPHAWLLPASTLKTLTSLVVLPALDPTSKVTATDAEVTADGTRVGMVSGATYSVTDLFYGLVLMSGNDTAYALADAYGGRDKTIAAMNALAGRLGAWDTRAVDPSGLDADGQHSSAYDLALFGRAVMKLPAYARYATTKDYTFPGGTDRNGKAYPPFAIQNHNTLLENYAGTIGIKNGYTTGARHTFLGAATRAGHTYLVAEMGGIVVPSWQPSAALLDWAFAHGGQVTPVGQLVDGAPQPPELGGTPAPTTAGTPVPSANDQEPGPLETAGGTTSTAPAVAGREQVGGSGGSGGNPGPLLVTSIGQVLRSPLLYALVAVLLLVGLGLRRVRVRRRGP